MPRQFQSLRPGFRGRLQEEQVLLEAGSHCKDFFYFSFHFPRLILFLLFVFQAQPTARAYVAYADNEEGMKGWISVILKQLDGGQGACSFLYSEVAFLQQTPLILQRWLHHNQ